MTSAKRTRSPCGRLLQAFAVGAFLLPALAGCGPADPERPGRPAADLAAPAARSAMDAASLARQVDDDPAGWLEALRRTPMISATDAWSCVCGWHLQQGDEALIEGWLARLAGGAQGPEHYLAVNEADAGLPAHYGRASAYGAAVAGCLSSLDALLGQQPEAARTRIEGFFAAVEQTLPASQPMALDQPTLFEAFWPAALDRHDGARQAFLAQWRPPVSTLACQQEIAEGWRSSR